MPGALLRLIITAIAIVVAAYLLPEYLSVGGVGSVVMFAVVLGVLNVLVKPVLLFLLCRSTFSLWVSSLWSSTLSSSGWRRSFPWA